MAWLLRVGANDLNDGHLSLDAGLEGPFAPPARRRRQVAVRRAHSCPLNLPVVTASRTSGTRVQAPLVLCVLLPVVLFAGHQLPFVAALSFCLPSARRARCTPPSAPARPGDVHAAPSIIHAVPGPAEHELYAATDNANRGNSHAARVRVATEHRWLAVRRVEFLGWRFEHARRHAGAARGLQLALVARGRRHRRI
jgi:hypothetical protein